MVTKFYLISILFILHSFYCIFQWNVGVRKKCLANVFRWQTSIYTIMMIITSAFICKIIVNGLTRNKIVKFNSLKK
jgi:hypothetical protein